MKYFQAKIDSKVNCDICGKIMIKGSRRLNKRIVNKEFGRIHSTTLYFHEDCYSKEGSKWICQ